MSNMPYHGAAAMAASLNLLAGAPAKKVWKPTIVHRGTLYSNTSAPTPRPHRRPWRPAPRYLRT